MYVCNTYICIYIYICIEREREREIYRERDRYIDIGCLHMSVYIYIYIYIHIFIGRLRAEGGRGALDAHHRLCLRAARLRGDNHNDTNANGAFPYVLHESCFLAWQYLC